MRDATVWRRALGVDRTTVIDKVTFDEEGDEDVVIVRVRQHLSRKLRCGKCGKVAGRYDPGEGRRRWRAHDVGLLRCYLEGEAPRVRCKGHGVVVAQVPWARHDARHTRAFDDQVAWLATHTAKSTLVALLRISWVTVGAIAARVVADGRAARDPFDGLVRIGIDEISYRRGHKYLTVVVDHDSGRLVWAAPGRDKATLAQFFDLLGAERAAAITLVSADAAEWIATVVAERCPNATLCADPFHMIAWATSAVDEVRRQIWRDAKRMGAPNLIARIKGCRYALLKNPENLTEHQQAGLARVAVVNKPLYRAYLLKEQFRLVFRLRGDAAITALDNWCQWARRCRIGPSSSSTTGSRSTGPPSWRRLPTDCRTVSWKARTRSCAFSPAWPTASALPTTSSRCACSTVGGYCPPLPGRQTA